MRFFTKMLILSLAITGTIAPPLAAQETTRTAVQDGVRVAQLRRGEIDRFYEAFTSRPPNMRALNRLVPEFSVPAVTQVVIICELDMAGNLFCVEEEKAGRCPGEIQIKFPHQDNPVTVPVDCTGPDGMGQCECEFS